jgi:hypothetical protein
VSGDPFSEEEQVGALMRRSDGPMIIRPLRIAAADRDLRYVQLFSAAAFTVVMIVLAAIGAGVINSLRQAGASAAPSTSTPAGVGPTSSSALPTASGPAAAGFTTAEGAADAAKQALERHDFQLLFRLVAPTGWYARWYEQTQTDPMSLVEAVGWVSMYPNATWRVEASEVRDAGTSRPLGDKYVTALVTDFGGWDEQRADIMLRPVGGRWFWSSL